MIINSQHRITYFLIIMSYLGHVVTIIAQNYIYRIETHMLYIIYFILYVSNQNLSRLIIKIKQPVGLSRYPIIRRNTKAERK